MGKQGDLRGELELGESTHAGFFFAQFTSPFFGLFCLVFSGFFLFVVPTTLYTCFLSDDGYLTIIYNRDLNITEP